jgi:uncharacterized protein Usg
VLLTQLANAFILGGVGLITYNIFHHLFQNISVLHVKDLISACNFDSLDEPTVFWSYIANQPSHSLSSIDTHMIKI